jgi:hypothetical protein
LNIEPFYLATYGKKALPEAPQTPLVAIMIMVVVAVPQGKVTILDHLRGKGILGMIKM